MVDPVILNRITVDASPDVVLHHRYDGHCGLITALRAERTRHQ